MNAGAKARKKKLGGECAELMEQKICAEGNFKIRLAEDAFVAASCFSNKNEAKYLQGPNASSN